MKKIFAIACLLIFYTTFVSAQAYQYTLITGNIKIPAGSEASVSYLSNPITGERTIVSTPVGYDGKFVLAFKIDQPTILRFEHAFENLQLYIQPLEQIQLSFEAEKMWKTLKFEGTNANNHNYMVAYYNEFAKEVDQSYIDIESENFNSVAFANFLDQRKQKQQTFYKNYTATKPLSPQFSEVAKADILYNWAYDRLRYQPQPTENLQATTYYQFLTEVPLNNPNLLNTTAYTNFLNTYILYKSNEIKPNAADINDKIAVAKAALQSGDLLYFTVAKLIMQACKNNEDFKKIEWAMDNLEMSDAPFEYIQATREVYKTAKKFAVGSPAPNWFLAQINDEISSLTDLKGKAIYLVFWASWCKPCLQQIEHIKNLQQYMANSPEFQIVYISIDENENAWKTAVTQKNIPGLHFITQGLKSQTAQDYNIAGVPLYFAIDQQGNFAPKPPRPSDTENLKFFMKSLLISK